MKYTLIDWIDAACKRWGFDRRRLQQARYPQSVCSRMDEPIGYGGDPEPLEGLRGDALYVSVAMQRALEQRRLPIQAHQVIYLHYDERYRKIPAKLKCKQLGVTRETYYYHLAKAHRIIDAYWPTDLDRDAKIA